MNSALSEKELKHWLALWRIVGIGSVQFSLILNHVSHISDMFHPDIIAKIQWPEAIKKQLRRPQWDRVALDLSWVEDEQNHIVTLQDPFYPAQLKNIPHPPPILFVRGAPELLSRKQIAIVGSRRASHQGKEITREFVKVLCDYDLVITSGLALGIDGASHQATLAADGDTIAVVGHGLDRCYPREHQKLAACIVASGGALVSMFPTKAPPMAKHFPMRNRIISGLSEGVVVVEAAKRSGSLITAHDAVEQGRDVFVVPGAASAPLAQGCHQLIKEGASLVVKPEDVLNELNIPLKEEAPRQAADNKQASFNKLPQIQKQMLTAIDFSATPNDIIVARTGLDVDVVSVNLMALVLQGWLVQGPGGYSRV